MNLKDNLMRFAIVVTENAQASYSYSNGKMYTQYISYKEREEIP